MKITRKVQYTSPEDLPGVKKKSFSLYFNNGEIWCEHLDGIYSFADIAIAKLEDDYKSFRRPSSPSLIAINIDETVATASLLEAIVQKLIGDEKRFTRVVFIGADLKARRMLKKQLQDAPFALAFINDFEKAKEWLL